MRKHTIGIVGAPNERHCLYLAQELRKQHAEPLILDNAPDIPFPLSLRGNEVYYNDRSLDDLHVLFMRALFLPTPAFDAREIETRVKEQGYAAYAAHRERYATWLSFLKTASIQDKRVVNPIDSLLLHFAKPYQTEILRSKDLPVPDTLITSNPDLLLEFCRDEICAYLYWTAASSLLSSWIAIISIFVKAAPALPYIRSIRRSLLCVSEHAENSAYYSAV